MLPFAQTVFAALTRRLARLGAILACAATLCLPPAVAAAGEVGIVQVPRLNLRPTPDVSGEPVAVLDEGVEVRVIGRRDGWVEVDSGSHRGFIRNRSRYLRIETRVDDAAATSAMVETRARADALAARLESSRTEVAAISAREQRVIADLDNLERGLAKMKAQAGATRRQMADLDNRMADIRERTAALQADIERQKAMAAKRLVAYYKIGWMGRIQLLATAETVQDLVLRERALSAILDADAQLLHRLADDRERLTIENRRLAEGRKAQAALSKTYDAQLADLAGEKSHREAVLKDIRQKKSLELAAIASLEASKQALDRTLETLAAEAAAAAAARPPAPPAAGTAVAVQAPPSRPFQELKGLLPFPVDGNISNRFGEYRDTRHNVVNFRSGVDIRADYGEPIRAVSDGTVLYADWFKGFGNMLIIDHGDHYYTVYAHLEETFKKKGDPVEADEVIATVGDSGSLTGPKLYFEVRHHGKPMDPAEWISKG